MQLHQKFIKWGSFNEHVISFQTFLRAREFKNAGHHHSYVTVTIKGRRPSVSTFTYLIPMLPMVLH